MEEFEELGVVAVEEVSESERYELVMVLLSLYSSKLLQTFVDLSLRLQNLLVEESV